MKFLLRPSVVMTLLLLLFMTACAQNGTGTPIAQTAMATTAVSLSDTTPAPTNTPLPTSAPTITAVSTPILPYIDAPDQPLTDDGGISFPRVMTTEAGWLVIYAEGDGELGDILGVAPLSTGINDDITISIDPMRATQTIIAMLHIDATPNDDFDFPDGSDTPLEYETAVIATPIQLDFQISQPAITVAPQEIRADGVLTVTNVLSPIAGWLVIQANDEGELGKVLGSAPIEAGLNEALTIQIPWREGTPTLYAVIYEDNGRSQRLDIPGEDTPLRANDTPVIQGFAVTYPPDIYVLDQPLVAATFVVERVISNGPGYLVVYYDNDGEPGFIAGSKRLVDGLNEQVKVEILDTAVTPILHLRLHEDSEPGDGFDFPRVDPPILYDDRLPPTVTFSNTPGNYLIVADQSITSTAELINIDIPYAVVAQLAWLVIYADEEGERGEILGYTPLELGLNRDLTVEVATASITDTLYAVLHLDGGEIGTFEPDGEDVPLQRSRQILQTPFQIERIEEIE